MIPASHVSLRPFIEDLLGTPYVTMNCYQFLTTVYRDGLGLALSDHPMQDTDHVVEIWFNEPDCADPVPIMQPWDILVMAMRGAAGDHVGVVVDQTYFAHTGRQVGMSLAPLFRYRRWLLQILRPLILQGGVHGD